MFKKSLFLLSISISVIWILITFYRNEIPSDPGDGVMHFYYAQASWENPIFFLNHWGKPLFILLSSPFAQLGFNGSVGFQILTFILTCFIANLILKKLAVKPFFSYLFPFLLILTNDYSTTILSPLTEPLFNLFCLIALFLFLKHKWILFAIIISFVPFLRSEGQLCVILALIILILNKQYKFIPFLLTGFILYGILGQLVFEDFWWYFTKSPYHWSNNIYGHGNWDHYFISYKNYIGNHGLIFFLLAIISIILYLKKIKITIELSSFIIFSYGLFFGILLSHSYFWAKGLNGSMGLTRITTQGMPLFLLVNINFVNLFLHKSSKKFDNIASYVVIAISLFFIQFSAKWPIKISGPDLQLKQSSEFLKNNSNKKQSIFYSHPLLGFLMNENPFLKNQQSKLYDGHDIEQDLRKLIKVGDFILWDNHFSKNEAGIPFNKICNLKELTMVNKFTSFKENQFEEGIYIFQFQDTNLKSSTINHPSIIKNKTFNFSDEFQKFQKFQKKSYQRKLNLLIKNNKGESFFVCSDKEAKFYSAINLNNKHNIIELNLLPDVEYESYFWNPKKRVNSIGIDSLFFSEIKFPKIIQTKH